MINLMKKIGMMLLLSIIVFSLSSPMFVVVLLLKFFTESVLSLSIDILLLLIMIIHLYISKKGIQDIIDLFKV